MDFHQIDHLNGQVIFTMNRAKNDAVCYGAINGFNAAENNAVVQYNTLVANNIAFDQSSTFIAIVD